jgi:hypothetical protein
MAAIVRFDERDAKAVACIIGRSPFLAGDFDLGGLYHLRPVRRFSGSASNLGVLVAHTLIDEVLYVKEVVRRLELEPMHNRLLGGLIRPAGRVCHRSPDWDRFVVEPELDALPVAQRA